jgi:four helix bundle protein
LSGDSYEEACAAESKADFIHKLQVVLKELRESIYWLTLLEKSKLYTTNGSVLSLILIEANKLSKITARKV